MFGYLQPKREDLKIRDYRLYKSVYCGLCKQMKKDYGLAATLTLSYDCTMLAMVYASLNKEECIVRQGRCTFNPLKKCMFCRSKEKAFHFAGAVSVIMAYYKLSDTIDDSGWGKRLLARWGKIGLLSGMKKASAAYPAIRERVCRMYQDQQKAEQKDDGIDTAAEPTAALLSDLCTMLSNDDGQKRILGVFGYFLGRLIYIKDAADDIQKDIKNGNYNPFRDRYIENSDDFRQYCTEAINLTYSQLVLAYDLIELTTFQSIIDNIIYTADRMPIKKHKEKYAEYIVKPSVKFPK